MSIGLYCVARGGGVISETGSSVDVHRFILCCKGGLSPKPEVA